MNKKILLLAGILALGATTFAAEGARDFLDTFKDVMAPKENITGFWNQEFKAYTDSEGNDDRSMKLNNEIALNIDSEATTGNALAITHAGASGTSTGTALITNAGDSRSLMINPSANAGANIGILQIEPTIAQTSAKGLAYLVVPASSTIPAIYSLNLGTGRNMYLDQLDESVKELNKIHL